MMRQRDFQHARPCATASPWATDCRRFRLFPITRAFGLTCALGGSAVLWALIYRGYLLATGGAG